jgi:hypothetical protein
MTKTLGVLVLTIAIVCAFCFGYQIVQSRYHWEKDFGSNWSLAEKASTIAQKSEYMDLFVNALASSNLSGTNDSLFFPTPDNGFDQNFKALQSLQARLQTIKTMDENSFQYQTAIEQITAQEQGQAQDMITTLENCWMKVNYYELWNPFSFRAIAVLIMILGGFGIVLLSV